MYANHFALNRDPFSIAPDPHFLFMSERHREALAHLLYGVTGSGGFVLFTGNIGTGKTTVCRCFLEQIPAGCKVALVFNPKLSVMELLQTICDEFQVKLKRGTSNTLKTYVDALNVFLLQSHAAGQSNVLIIDEAQNLLPEVLEQLRLLTNLETHERKLMQIVLIGQPELRTMLERPDLEQLAQRVTARYHLNSLNKLETALYIEHRLKVAGLNGPVPLDEAALRRIHWLTGGVPRRINLVCGRALLGAWATGSHEVTRAMVDKAAAEVLGDDPAYRVLASRPVTAAVLATVGVLSLAVAIGLRLLPQSGFPPDLGTLLPRAVASAPASPSASSASGSASLPGPALAVAAASASASASASARAQTPFEDLELLLPRLPQDMNVALRELAQLWQLDPASSAPCQSAAAAQLQCYRAGELTIPLLLRLDRPGVLALQKGSEPPVYALLSGLDAHSATLRLNGDLHQVSLIALARVWRGDFATFWKPPIGYHAELREGERSVALGLLSDQLAQLEGGPVRSGPAPGAMPLDAELTARVRAFQRGQGIRPDGHPGPMTFMQVEKALGASGPSLQAEVR